MKKKLIEALGWYGVAAILIAYTLLSFGILTSSDLLYQVFNLTGAICIIIDALAAKNYQPAVLNSIWFIVALIAIVKTLLG